MKGFINEIAHVRTIMAISIKWHYQIIIISQLKVNMKDSHILAWKLGKHKVYQHLSTHEMDFTQKKVLDSKGKINKNIFLL